MRHRYLASLGALAGALLWLASIPVDGQAPAADQGDGSGRRRSQTAWGDPDLQGVWHVMAQVPLERAQQYQGREFLTDEEVAALDKGKAENLGRNSRAAAGTAQDVGGAYNAVFNSILKTGKRTSMIIDPKDGRIPPLTEEAQNRQGGAAGAAAAAAAGRRPGGPSRAGRPGSRARPPKAAVSAGSASTTRRTSGRRAASVCRRHFFR